ncbi:MAG: hypothetical protein V1913_16535, partial [Fibrobacterota bacterium]
IAQVRWNGGDGNSFWVKMDTLPYEKFGNDGADTRWIPIKGPVWHLTQGRHTLVFREREWGAALGNVMLTPLPAYVSSAVAFGNAVTLIDTLGFHDSLFFTPKPRLLLQPGYSLVSDSLLSFNLFFADADKKGLLASAKKVPLSIIAPDGKVLHSGNFTASDEVTVTLAGPAQGRYVIKAGGLSREWHLLGSRLEKLTQALTTLTEKESKSEAEAFWRPTLELCRDNILRGYRVRHQSDVNLPDLAYVLAEFTRAEAILAALKSNATAGLLKPGIQELAHYSETDSMLCPYTLYLPKTWSPSAKPMPFVLYLHGTGGTQWEFERGMEANHQPIDKLAFPMLDPYGRGNANWMNEAEKDLLTLLDIAARRFHLDTANVLLTGFSMGGFGTWNVGTGHPGKFNVLAPVAGGLPWEWERVKNPSFKAPEPLLPVGWKGRVLILHASDDNTVPFASALRAAETLAATGHPFQLSVYRGGHAGPANLFEIYNALLRGTPIPLPQTPTIQ